MPVEREAAALPEERAVRPVPAVAAGLMTILSILWAIDAPRVWFGLTFYPAQFLVLVMGIALFIAYLTLPARRGSGAGPAWYDWICAVVGLLTLLWTAVHWERLLYDVGYRTPEVLAIGIVTVLLTLEALRRATGYTLLLVVLAFIAYAFVGDLVPGQLKALAVGADELFIYLAFNPAGIFGTPLKIGAEVVLVFIFFGELLLRSGGGDLFNDLAMATMGRQRAGGAKIAVVSSALFGMINGSAVANVVSSGVITIPMMRREGFSDVDAGAIEAVSSTAGQFTPPIMGAAAFLMAEFLQISYAEVAIAAAIPAFLYYVAVYVQVDLIAARDKIAYFDRALPRLREVARAGWHFALPLGILFYALFWLYLEPEEAAIYACAAIVAVGVLRSYKGYRLTPANLVRSVVGTGMGMVELILILAAAGCVIGILNQTGLGFALPLALVKLAGASVAVLLVVAAVTCIVLGMGMPTSGVYVLLAALVAPGIVEAGIEPLAAHMFILYFGMMSMLTPPVALAAYAAAALSGASAMRTGFASVRFAWVAFVVPFVFVFAPSLLLIGDPLIIVATTLTACIGVFLITVSFVGYLVSPLSIPVRSLFMLAGIATLLPAAVIPWGVAVDLAGIALGVALVSRECLAQRRRRAAPA